MTRHARFAALILGWCLTASVAQASIFNFGAEFAKSPATNGAGNTSISGATAAPVIFTSFPPSGTASVTFPLPYLPADAPASPTIQCRLHFLNPWTDTTNSAVFSMAIFAFPANGPHPDYTAFGSNTFSFVPSAQNTMFTHAQAAAVAIVNRTTSASCGTSACTYAPLLLQLTRLGDNGGDTNAGTLYLKSMECSY